MTATLSIVIPALNEVVAIESTLRALALMRARGVEVIVADGGSTDSTADHARPLADQVLTAPRGRARQMNAGAAVASGEVVLFLHADTLLPADADQLVGRAVDAGAAWGRFDVRIAGRPRMLRVVAALMNARSRWTGVATGDQAIFIRRTVFDCLGGFPDQPLMEDVELCRRLRAVGRPACLRARVTSSGRRWESRGVWRTVFLMWCLRWRYWRGRVAARAGRGLPMKLAGDTDLIVFSKAPVAGLVKTRLQPALGAAGAAALAERLLDHAISVGMAAGFANVELCAAPDASHPTFTGLATRYPGLHLSVQGAGDLGARMHRALARRLMGRERVLLIGTDAPALDAAMLREAAQALADQDAVFVPALDGGYALVGLARPRAELFASIAWSTPTVMDQTRERARAAGVRWTELPAVADIDEPADLVHLPAGWLP